MPSYQPSFTQSMPCVSSKYKQRLLQNMFKKQSSSMLCLSVILLICSQINSLKIHQAGSEAINFPTFSSGNVTTTSTPLTFSSTASSTPKPTFSSTPSTPAPTFSFSSTPTPVTAAPNSTFTFTSTSTSTSSCQQPRSLNNHGVCTCSDGRNYDAQSNQCNCPAYSPFWNGQYCTGCPAGMGFNRELNICYVCPEGYQRGTKIMTCQPALEPLFPMIDDTNKYRQRSQDVRQDAVTTREWIGNSPDDRVDYRIPPSNRPQIEEKPARPTPSLNPWQAAKPVTSSSSSGQQTTVAIKPPTGPQVEEKPTRPTPSQNPQDAAKPIFSFSGSNSNGGNTS